MAEALSEPLGNPTGSHRPAQRARRLLEESRDEIAALLGRDPGGIVFTSGGTESANLAVFGTLAAASHDQATPSLLCSAVEHPAVLESCRAAAGTGSAKLQEIPVDSAGLVDVVGLADLVEPHTTLVAVMLANNETGVIEPLGRVVEAVRAQSATARIFTDAVQAASFVDLAADTAGADLVAVSAHKLGGPIGVGVLAERLPSVIAPHQYGGGQERERRSGTQNVVGAVGLATALRLAAAERDAGDPARRRAAGCAGPRPDRRHPRRPSHDSSGRGHPARSPPPVPSRGRTGGTPRRVGGAGHLCLRWFVVRQRGAPAQPRPLRHGRLRGSVARSHPVHVGTRDQPRRMSSGRSPSCRRWSPRCDTTGRWHPVGGVHGP